MKSTALKISAFVLALAASTGALAASQGTAGATSTGSYTNTLGTVAPPQVRVFGLLDANLTATSGSVTSPWGPMPGVSDQFCVAHSTGGNVRITFSSPGISAGGLNIQAKSATTGATKIYNQLIYRTGTVPTDASAIRSSVLSFDITSAQSDLVNCVNPNVTKTIVLSNGATWSASETDVFTDTVTVTASPI
ncbi:hypothetical protein [uncultured Dechloromonas sp.]|uniref:hypothetical protein n=1 Tax=uncultured Dechloromonas sp. TaxID=171719 RepID=UPI0025F2B263|nr:hypothetical protein [uncultured Dechloromonas sp.]